MFIPMWHVVWPGTHKKDMWQSNAYVITHGVHVNER